MEARCRLCGSVDELQESHVLPKFVFKWLKDTSGTGYLRLGREPNKRVQDGYKRPWLCSNCEGLLNQWETLFANAVFHPINASSSARVRYGPWLLKFCISVSWRVLSTAKEDGGLNHFSDTQRDAADRALKAWSDFLFDKLPHPGVFEQHLLPLDAIQSYEGGDLPANINRYLLRTVDMDTVCNDRTAFVFSKVGRFVIVGFIDLREPRTWSGTKVHVREGVIEPRSYSLPAKFAEYLIGQARRFAEIHKKISPRQREKIDENMERNLEQLADSESFAAMDHDVRLFGTAAFDIHRADDEC